MQPLKHHRAVRGNLRHATAAFTLDVYGHVTDQMKQESARRMESSSLPTDCPPSKRLHLAL